MECQISRKLSEHYGWPVYSIGRLWRDEWQRLYPRGEVPFEDFWGGTTLADNLQMNDRAMQIFSGGHVIGDTRYPIYCTEMPALLVFTTADIMTRARRVSGRYEGKSTSEIAEILLRREGDEVRKGMEMYGEGYDYRNPLNYHMTLNSGLLTPDEKLIMIAGLVEREP